MPKKRYLVVLLALLILIFPSIYFMIEWCFAGGGFKVLYYNFYGYDPNKVRVVEDSDFLFSKKGYSRTYILNSDFYVGHRILLIPEAKTVPIEYEYSGEILIEIFDSNNSLLQSSRVNRFNVILRRKKEGDFYGNYLIYVGRAPRNASSVFAFELGDIPFDLVRLKWKRLRSMKVRVTVVKPDKGLQELSESATLVIIPDLRT